MRRFLANLVSLLALSCASALPAHAAAPPSATDTPVLADCNQLRDLAFVAHMDDDLLFMNPDLADTIQAGGCLTVVYLTASERDEGEEYMRSREAAVRMAHAHAAGQADQWREDTIEANGHTIARYTLQGNARIQLLHMRLRDPWLGKGWGSLTPLSQAESQPGQTVDTLTLQQHYDRDSLVATLASLIRTYQPTTVRHLDDTSTVPYTSLCWRCVGHGHPDHIASARLARDAMLQAPGTYAAVGYVDYPTQDRAANLAATEAARKADIFLQYAWLDRRYCAHGKECNQPFGPTAAWVARSYYVTRHDAAPVLATQRDGSLLLAAASEWSNAAATWNPVTRLWLTLGGRTAEPPALFNWSDGTPGMLLRDGLGTIWSNRQAPDGSWGTWQAVPGARLSALPHLTAKGTAAVALANDGRLYWSAQQSDAAAWQAWRPLPELADARADTAVVKLHDTRLMVFARTADGRIASTQQQTADGDTWAPWQLLAAPASSGGLAAIDSADGLELYLLGQDGELHRMIRPANTNAWLAAQDLDLPASGQPAIGLDEQGDVVLAAQARPGGPVWLIDDGVATQLDGQTASPPALSLLGHTLYVAARDAGTAQTYRLWLRDGGTWRASSTAALAGL